MFPVNVYVCMETYLYKRRANIQLSKELIPHFVGKLAQCHLSFPPSILVKCDKIRMTKLLDNVQYADIFVQVWEIPNNIKHAAAKETVDKIFFILAKGDSTFLPFTLARVSAT